MMDMPGIIDDHRQLWNLLEAQAQMYDKLQSEAPNKADLSAQGPTDTKSQARFQMGQDSPQSGL
jgi:hypothetical protein